MGSGEAGEEFDRRDTVIYLIQVQADKNRSVSGKSLCYTHRHGSVTFKETTASSTTRHNRSWTETAAVPRDPADLWQISNSFKDCLNSVRPSLIPCTHNEWKERRTAAKFSWTL